LLIQTVDRISDSAKAIAPAFCSRHVAGTMRSDN
jgi:hypothetical protein